jgi:hypothetical protein
MEREFEETLREIENRVPKDLIKEYVTEDGAKVRDWSAGLSAHNYNRS